MKQKICFPLFIILMNFVCYAQNKVVFNATGNGITSSNSNRVTFAVGQNVIGMTNSNNNFVYLGLLGPVKLTTTNHELSDDIFFRIQQNYPNPFKEITQIPFEISQYENVKLSIKDVLGNQLSVLIDQKMQPGKYLHEFHARHLAAGLYFYQLKVNGHQVTKPMIVTK